MSGPESLFLNLPIELRNTVYSYALTDHQPEIPLSVKGSSVVWHGTAGINYLERPIAFLLHDQPKLLCPLALPQVNHQIRTEFSDFLRTAPVDIVSKVRNFDFRHVISFFESLPGWRREQSLVMEDGSVHSNLCFEFGGPYDAQWRSNLMHWIEFVDNWTDSSGHELKTLHKTIQDLSNTDRGCRAPVQIIWDVWTTHRSHRKGAGRLELDKIFYTLKARFEAELMMRGGLPIWWSDVHREKARWLLRQ